ncbi:hypothetical protein GWK47_017499 [Chionoecetes opilio]|uniref:Uncharacterized protein n=1 Tax=Chionoecetes opilio TaxID=41210 RepID=A0A8J4XRS8_CHIOP|nr:hypothetical protein GWK47_017499 [Chionoecetes opilio]
MSEYVDSFKDLKELILMEHFTNIADKDIGAKIREKHFKCLKEAATWADDRVLALRGSVPKTGHIKMNCAKWKATQSAKPVAMIVGSSQGGGRGLEEDKGGTVASVIFAKSLHGGSDEALEALHEEAKPLGLEVSSLKTKVQHMEVHIDMCADVRRLPILEALYMKEINPKLNVQANDLQALPSMKRTKANNSLLTEKPSEDQTTNQRLPLKKTRSKSYLPINDIGNRLRGRQTGYK